MERDTRFTIARESTSPQRSMARGRKKQKVPRMNDKLLDDIRPMIWSAQVIAPAAVDANVTVLMRVSYRTLEEICGALFEDRAPAVAQPRLS